MMLDRLTRFEQVRATFPESVQPLLMRLPEQGGKLDHDSCQELMAGLNISLAQLMVKLLPLAAVFANVPLSGFSVGAVAQTESRSEPSQKELYLGANLEFENITLNATIHAEQSAIMNAWHQNGGRLLAVAGAEDFSDEPWDIGDALRALSSIFTGVLWRYGPSCRSTR